YVCEAANSQTFFEVGIDHGKNPENASYAYAIIPYTDCKSLAAYRDEPEVKIISNTPECQAAEKPSLGLKSYVFYGAGECDGVKVSGPAIVSILEKNGETVVSLSDMTQKQRSVRLALPFAGELVSAGSGVRMKCESGAVSVDVNTFMAHGRRFEIKIKKANR
ncbi:MAG: hypothetical protein J6Q69_05135, partial [Clostridia bacterium]|nr:hypothetical protein [Clostridia bacterium]